MNLFPSAFSVQHLQSILNNFSDSVSITNHIAIAVLSFVSSIYKFHSSLCERQKLGIMHMAHATIILEPHGAHASSVKYTAFYYSKCALHLTFAANNCLSN